MSTTGLAAQAWKRQRREATNYRKRGHVMADFLRDGELFLKDFERDARATQRILFRLFWWVIPAGLVAFGSFLAFLAWLLKWVLHG